MSVQARDRVALAGGVLGRAPAFAMVVVAIGVVAMLFELTDILLINPDTVQLMSTARNLLSGEGLSTSIIYYDPQYDAGGVPVPQTVWPPAYAFMLAAALAMGVSAGATAIAIGVISHAAIAFLLYAILRHAKVGAAIALMAAVIWLLHTAEWYIVLAAYTEPFFMALTLLSAWCVLRGADGAHWNLRWLALGGVAAALAILTRYTGVLWPFVVGLWCLGHAAKLRSWRPVIGAVAFGAAPAAATAGLVLRNYLLTGRLSGGQYEFGSPASVPEALKRTFWELEPVLGPLLSDSAVVLLLALSACAVAVLLVYRQSAPRAGTEGASVRAVMQLSAGYIAATLGFLLGNAVAVSSGFLQYRYFVPAAPFALLLIGIAAHGLAMTFARSVHARRWLSASLLGALCLPASSLLLDFAQQWPPVPEHPAVSVIDRALDEKQPNGKTLGESLAAGSSDLRPILAHHEHRVALLTNAPVYGLSDARFTRRIWTTEDVARLVRDRGIEQVLFFPTTYDPKAPENANTPFFTELKSGRTPSWLQRRHASELVWIFDVRDATS